MNARILKLKEEILDAEGKWGLERARLYTQAERANETEVAEVKRARALAHYLDNKTVIIKEGELIVGNYGSGRGIYEIYPEYSFQDSVIRYIHFDCEQEVNDSFFETQQEKREFNEIRNYWRGKTMRERVDTVFPEYVVKLRDLDICCNPYGRDEGQGHVAVNYELVVRQGLRSVIERAKKRMEEVFDHDPIAYTFNKAAVIALEAVIRYAHRFAQEAERQWAAEKDEKRRAELKSIAANMRRVPEYPAGDFWQGCQAVWFIHQVMHMEQNGFSISIGRFDQYIYPLFKKDVLDGGRFTDDFAFEILQCFYLKFSEITIGGIKISLTQTVTICGRDAGGNDMTNELSHRCMDASMSCRVLNPQTLVRWHRNLDPAMVRKVIEAVRGGETHAAFFNDEVVVPALEKYGVKPQDALQYAQCGCNETEIPGKMIGGGMPRPLFLLRVVELALFGGVWRYTGEQVGPKTRSLAECDTFEEFLESYRTQYNHFIKYISYATNMMDYLHSQYTPLPFASALMDGCIERGRDMLVETEYFYYTLGCNDFIAAVNNLAAVKKAVFDDRSVEASQLMDAIENNWSGYEHLQKTMLATPKFGNDDDGVDHLVPVVEKISAEAISGLRSFRNNSPWFCECIPRISHVYEGIVTRATPEGRNDKDTLPPGISAQIGTDLSGSTALLNSISKLNPEHFAGGVISNIRFHPNLLKDDESITKIMALVNAYMKKGGMHLQMNCVTRETLLDAMENPSKHKDLMVRVSGYIDYFTNLDRASQADIIARTEQTF
ncbi:glycyl radical enzyme [Bacteroidia bacterium]|nr:glycyl radical enzyme [Bacteroidia bacterium]